MRRMRGDHHEPDSMFSYVSPEQRIPKDHPLRAIRALADKVLADMSREFDRLYATTGRPSIPPERLLRAQLLQVFYSIRSELLLMEQLDYNLLFRWFVGLTMDDPVWDATTFTKNRDRLLDQEIARSFFHRVRTSRESQPTGWKRGRRPHHTARGLRDESACPATHRTRVRLVEDDRLDAQGQTPRLGEGRLARGVRERRVQSDPVAEIAAEARMMTATCLQSAGRRQ
jgi:transposase